MGEFFLCLLLMWAVWTLVDLVLPPRRKRPERPPPPNVTALDEMYAGLDEKFVDTPRKRSHHKKTR